MRGSFAAGSKPMTPVKIVAILLIALGVCGLVYGGFSYTSETHSATIAGMELSLDETKRVNIPLWAGIGAIVGGVLLLSLRK